MPYTAGLYCKWALLNLAGWLLLFYILILLGNYMSPDAYLLDPSPSSAFNSAKAP